MYYSYIEIEFIATSFSPAQTDLALKLLIYIKYLIGIYSNSTTRLVYLFRPHNFILTE